MVRVPNWREYDDDDEESGPTPNQERRDATRDKKAKNRPLRMKD